MLPFICLVVGFGCGFFVVRNGFRVVGELVNDNEDIRRLIRLRGSDLPTDLNWLASWRSRFHTRHDPEPRLSRRLAGPRLLIVYCCRLQMLAFRHGQF